jgi:HPt (histidine-containing phosphotransfer) domain-containing protein
MKLPDNNHSPAEDRSEDIDLSELTAFGEMGTAGEPDVVVELIDLYLKDGPERIRQIKHAAVTADQILLKKAIHTFKGSSGSLGFHQIVELCKQLANYSIKSERDLYREAVM